MVENIVDLEKKDSGSYFILIFIKIMDLIKLLIVIDLLYYWERRDKI